MASQAESGVPLEVKNAVGDVASTIRSYLHFSVPDVGPLTDYESWMPDFMKGLSKGIEKSKYLVTDMLDGLTADMVVKPGMESGEISRTSHDTSLVSSLINKLTETLSGMGQHQEIISIPVYVGGTLLDEIVVNAQDRQNLRSGGR